MLVLRGVYTPETLRFRRDSDHELLQGASSIWIAWRFQPPGGKNQLEDGQTTFDIFFFDQQNCIPFIFHGACYCTKYRWWSWEHLGQARISWGSILEKALPAVKRVASYTDRLCQASMSYVEDWLRPGSRWENHQHFIQEAFLIVHCSCHCKVCFFTWVDSMQLYRYTGCISFCAKNIVERQHQPFNYLVESWVFPNVQIPGVIENMTFCQVGIHIVTNRDATSSLAAASAPWVWYIQCLVMWTMVNWRRDSGLGSAWMLGLLGFRGVKGLRTLPPTEKSCIFFLGKYTTQSSNGWKIISMEVFGSDHFLFMGDL